LKKKAQEKLAAKANPVAETVVVEVSEPEVNEAVAEVPAVEANADVAVETEAVVETPAEEAAAE
jgi:small subunit ribosomal protein S16